MGLILNTATYEVHWKVPLPAMWFSHAIWAMGTKRMAYMQYRRLRKRAFQWLIEIDRLHRALHRLELNANLNTVRTLCRNSCWVSLSGTRVWGQRLHNLLHHQNEIPQQSGKINPNKILKQTNKRDSLLNRVKTNKPTTWLRKFLMDKYGDKTSSQLSPIFGKQQGRSILILSFRTKIT